MNSTKGASSPLDFLLGQVTKWVGYENTFWVVGMFNVFLILDFQFLGRRFLRDTSVTVISESLSIYLPAEVR